MEAKKKQEEEKGVVEQVEEAKKKLSRDMEGLLARIQQLEGDNDRLSKSKKKVQSELDDLNVELENYRTSISAMEKKQKKFDQNLAEEKAISERSVYVLIEHQTCHFYNDCSSALYLWYSRLAMDRDNAERESREKETKILSLSRELEELRDRLEEVERMKSQQQRELEDLMSSKDDVGKNVCGMISAL